MLKGREREDVGVAADRSKQVPTEVTKTMVSYVQGDCREKTRTSDHLEGQAEAPKGFPVV